MPIAVLACLPTWPPLPAVPYAVAFSQLTTSLKLTQTYLQVPKTAEAHYGVMTKGSRGGWAVAC